MLVKLNVINRDGAKSAIEVDEGTTIRNAIEDKIEPESFGLCGGNCNCGTCHVYVDLNYLKKLNPADEAENRIIKKFADNPNNTSRLSCQIELKKEHDGITVTIGKESLENFY